ncbi:MAG: FAD-dependent thymidylate synthase [Thermotogae bacterium]|nr:FAD-dependent thymidylate synthase [Thermotogota bacterium]
MAKRLPPERFITFKTFWQNGRLVYNLRHFTEVIPNVVHRDALAPFENNPLGQPVLHDAPVAIPGVKLQWTRLEMDGADWGVIVLEGPSRCFSHQFVRHTTLNFNQRSHRYTQVQDVLVPPTCQRRGDVAAFLSQAEGLYEKLVEDGIPKEDARYLYPHGVRTTIMASGPLALFRDFVEKRSVPGAQWEAKEVAKAIKNSLLEGV